MRSYEAFKLLHLGMISEIKRKSLPAIAKAVGLDNHQNLHHFLTESPWQVQQLRQKRLELTLKVLNGRSLILLIGETGDCKKGKSTDYVKRQYIGNVGKKENGENGIVAVTAYGLVEGMIVPLMFEVYKPRERLKDEDEYQSATSRVNDVPQQSLMRFRLNKTPYFIGFGFCILPLAKLDDALSGFYLGEFSFIHRFEMTLPFFNSSMTVVGLM